jgi:hypothetical protein
LCPATGVKFWRLRVRFLIDELVQEQCLLSVSRHKSVDEMEEFHTSSDINNKSTQHGYKLHVQTSNRFSFNIREEDVYYYSVNTNLVQTQHAFHVSACCGHHQVHTAFIITLLSATPPCTGQCLHIGNALYRHVVYVTSPGYKIY